jgi:hypothetical protein
MLLEALLNCGMACGDAFVDADVLEVDALLRYIRVEERESALFGTFRLPRRHNYRTLCSVLYFPIWTLKHKIVRHSGYKRPSWLSM